MMYFKSENLRHMVYKQLAEATSTDKQNIKMWYNVENTIGKGHFGVVKMGVHKKTFQKVAIKKIKKGDIDAKDEHQLRREIDVLRVAKHPNVVSLIDLFESS